MDHVNNVNNVNNDDKEIYYWCMYDWGNSVFSTPTISLLLPILLERLSTQTACDSLENGCDMGGNPIGDNIKYVNFLTIEITPNTYSFMILGLSVFVQAFIFISYGAYADYGNNRKKYLYTTAILGSIMLILFIIFIAVNVWWLPGILTIICNTLFGLSIVFYNSYLPLIVRNQEVYKNNNNNVDDCKKIEEKLSNEISTRGYIYGYLSGFLSTLIALGILMTYPHGEDYNDMNTNNALYLAISLMGLWWLVFSIYSLRKFKDYPGKVIPNNIHPILFSWNRTIQTIKNLKHFPEMRKYIISYFLFSDGYSTISTCGILYAKAELGISENILLQLLIMMFIVSCIGNYFFLYIQKKFDIEPKKILMSQLIGYIFLSIYGFFIKDVNYMIIFGIIHGFLIGSVQSYSRTIFMQLIPVNEEAQFFSLYEISDKGSSWLGPIIFAVISQYVSIRYGFIYIFSILCISLPLLYYLNMKQGIIDREYNINDTDNDNIDV